MGTKGGKSARAKQLSIHNLERKGLEVVRGGEGFIFSFLKPGILLGGCMSNRQQLV